MLEDNRTFKRQGDQILQASATPYLALEAAHAGLESAPEFIRQAKELIKDLRYRAPEVLNRAK